ncbi:MAG: ribonuclease P protein component [Ignavibacteriae bacterium]|nr:ribonuclease P protein component [Ignavibacteriota bacterium]
MFTKLFTTGKTQSAGAIRCFYTSVETATSGVQAGFTVTRNIRNSPTRNKIKRLMRESWRQRQSGVRICNGSLQIVFLYYKPTDRKVLNLQNIDSMMQKLVEKLNKDS